MPPWRQNRKGENMDCFHLRLQVENAQELAKRYLASGQDENFEKTLVILFKASNKLYDAERGVRTDGN